MKTINKLVYDKTQRVPQVHVINIPPSEHEFLYCGKEKIEIENRVYQSSLTSLPIKYSLCPECQTENRKKLAEVYNLPEWIGEK